MQKVLSVALVIASALFATAVHADRITYFKAKGGDVELAVLDDLTITKWSASKVDYTTGDKKSGSIATKDIVSLERSLNGTLSSELNRALQSMGGDPAAARDALSAIANGDFNALDREEAAYMLAELWANETAGGNKAATQSAIKAYNDYIRSYKSGYFASSAYQTLAKLQNTADARKTLKNMISADSALALEGNQALGRLEASEAKWSAAISAFSAAKSAAAKDKNKNAEYLAQAWEGLATLKSGKRPAATTLLEAVVNDDKFDDPNSVDDEIALATAYRALGEAYYEGETYEKAYDAFVQGAYYSWWTQGGDEGFCMGQAYRCAKQLEGTDEKWKKRKSKLRTALAMGYPRLLQDIDNE